jgi:hypothetical protein
MAAREGAGRDGAEVQLVKAFFIISMVLEVEDGAALEDWRASMESSGWNSLIETMQEELGEGLTEQVVDDAILFYGVQAWPLPNHP